MFYLGANSRGGGLNRGWGLNRGLTVYNDTIREQIAEGMVEEISKDTPAGKNEFYIPHRPVIRQQAQTMKLRIVYDGSARENERCPSLNGCLKTGPPLQNMLWDIIIRNRFHPIILTGDLKKAFLAGANSNRSSRFIEIFLGERFRDFRSCCVTIFTCFIWAQSMSVFIGSND